MVAASYDDVTPLTVGSSTCWHNLTMILTPSPKLRRVEAANDPAATLTECLNCARRGAPRCQNRSLLCLARPLPEPAQRDQCAFKVEIAVRVGIPIQAYVTSLDSRPAMTIAADLEKSLESHGCFTPSNRTWTAAARLPRRPTRGATSASGMSCHYRIEYQPRGPFAAHPGAGGERLFRHALERQRRGAAAGRCTRVRSGASSWNTVSSRGRRTRRRP